MQSNFMKLDKLLLFFTILMFVFGLFMMFSASSVEASLSGSPYHYFIKQAVTLAICFIASLIIIIIPLEFYKKTTIFFVIFVMISLVSVYLYGTIAGNARSWINLGFYNFQPSEFAKTAVILYMAVHYHKYKGSNNLIAIAIPLLVAMGMCGLIILQPDFGTTLIIFILSIVLFFSIPFASEIKKSVLQFASLGAIVTILFILVTGSPKLTNEQLERLDYQKPCTKYLTGGSGYQVCNGFIAINNGGLWGVGIGNSTQKYLYLPAAYTDFIFAVILEETGLITGFVILLIYMIILALIVRIALRSSTLMGSIIAYGTAIYLFLHIAVNLVGVLGILPLTGVPLPFLSYGGSYTLNLAVLLALVQRVEIERKRDIQKRLLI